MHHQISSTYLSNADKLLNNKICWYYSDFLKLTNDTSCAHISLPPLTQPSLSIQFTNLKSRSRFFFSFRMCLNTRSQFISNCTFLFCYFIVAAALTSWVAQYPALCILFLAMWHECKRSNRNSCDFLAIYMRWTLQSSASMLFCRLVLTY